ncbi:hypothetical protein [Mesorhizobium sp. M7A.F.Ca.US.010.02.1.1]|uniref:hypothetical protein n=1 Tax=Mesorhizobium sp. M7A.F.Ca.US.010.02.1.1 TaxID=2496743 RepID=UPI000FD5F217|nr:hypothetical protein [Mesorhizobium sp. M7A.F.Ca.US.010.02.1.1]RUW91269.1 hypothetical protein EOA19_16020 [Mesorhizobium sp. M7A.F.Ca.US.010.02.1.1]
MDDNQNTDKAKNPEVRFASAFDDGKRLSDFIGMIVRMSFVLFVTLYFIKKGQETPVPFNVIFLFCAIVFGLLAAKMLVFLNQIMAKYIGEKYLVANSVVRMKLLIVVLSIAMLIFSIGFGVFLMDGAQALLKK